MTMTTTDGLHGEWFGLVQNGSYFYCSSRYMLCLSTKRSSATVQWLAAVRTYVRIHIYICAVLNVRTDGWMDRRTDGRVRTVFCIV
jgi:hypothetical protein